MKRLLFDDVVLREFTEEDIAHKIKWINDAENNEHLHYDLPLEYEKTLQWWNNAKNNTSRLDCVIEYRGEPVGIIGLLNIDCVNKKAEYYITVGERSAKRKGVGFRASKLIIEYAFEVLDLQKVYLNVDEENSSACALYEKIGFICEGVFVKELFHRGRFINRRRYAILRREQK